MERFLARVQITEGCHLWTGGTNQNGYGTFYDGRRIVRVHRWIYQQRHGALPIETLVCHSCDNPRCVRDEHHFPGSLADNMRDAATKKRMPGWLGVNRARAKKRAADIERAVMADRRFSA